MIALIFGWNLLALGVVTACLGMMLGSSSGLIVAFVFLAVGFAFSFLFRKACADYRSDPPKQPGTERKSGALV